MGKSALFAIGGLNIEQETEAPFALIGNTVCTSSALPALPQKRRAGFLGLVNQSLIYCGGRQDLLQINAECWRLDLGNDQEISNSSWEVTDDLPRALAGAASIGLDDKLWVFGGVVEEDFYQNRAINDNIDYYDNQIQHEYYDYVVEETGNGNYFKSFKLNSKLVFLDVFVYDSVSGKWEGSDQLPMPLQGSCAVEHKGKIFLLGGKNEKDFPTGSNQVWQFDPETKVWNTHTWPKMINNRYYHGCTLFSNNGQVAIAIGGGQGCFNCSEKVEFLELPNENDLEKGVESLEGIVKWNQLANTNFPHAFMPAMAFVDGFLYIIGGGEFALSMSGDKIERFQDGKWWSFGHAPVRTFGSSLTLPKDWLKGCDLEPNLGIHDYYQRRTQDKLKGKKWLCFNDNLLLSDQEQGCVILITKHCGT